VLLSRFWSACSQLWELMLCHHFGAPFGAAWAAIMPCEAGHLLHGKSLAIFDRLFCMTKVASHLGGWHSAWLSAAAAVIAAVAAPERWEAARQHRQPRDAVVAAHQRVQNRACHTDCDSESKGRILCVWPGAMGVIVTQDADGRIG